MRNGILMAAALGFGVWLTACDTPEEKKSELKFGANPKTLAVGATTELWNVSRTVVEANGRTVTDESYDAYRLTSSDTAIAAIRRDKQVEGKVPGTVKITAHDTKTSLVTAPATLTVEAVLE